MKEEELQQLEEDQIYDIAIIGMSGKFPNSPNLDAYWKNIAEGIECISFFDDDELEIDLPETELKNPAFVKAGGTIDGIEYFDADFFGIPSREAAWMDPQQRLFLEHSWNAFEHAGYDVNSISENISIYCGTNTNFYLLSRIDQLTADPNNNLFQLMLANEKDFLATRISYKLDLKGESITVQTSCSTSLVAVHLACQSLLNYQSKMALAGGVSIRVPQKTGYFYQQGMIASPDGHCRAFDEKAEGTVPGNGVGVVVLKRLAEAVRDGDTIYAVIKGSAINNDGQNKVGFTAPSIKGQSDVIAKALAMSGVKADTIDYIEAHGTGTSIGDPIEISALSRAFEKHTDKTGFCAVSSVKSNIGHLDNAAGIAGLIKTVMALRNKTIPPTLHFEKPNPNIDFENSPFFVCAETRNWEKNDSPRRAGVSSFGIGGTNAHLILEEFEAREISYNSDEPFLLTISAKTPDSAVESARNLAIKLSDGNTRIEDLEYTQNSGRADFNRRCFAVGNSGNELITELQKFSTEKDIFSADENIQTAFLFSGQGTQKVNIARGIWEFNGIFREEFENCRQILGKFTDIDLQETVYPSKIQNIEYQNVRLQNPSLGLPVLFSIQYSMAKMLIRLGIKLSAVGGHSFGEYPAAAIAGIFSLEDGLKLSVERGKLMETLPAGAMLAVRLEHGEIEKIIDKNVSIASINTKKNCVVSGSTESISALEKKLDESRIGHRRLDVNYAYHSESIDLLKKRFEEIAGRIKFNSPEIMFVSGVSGKRISDEEVMKPDYWFRQMREPVRFSESLEWLEKSNFKVFAEIGAGQILTPMVRQNTGKNVTAVSISGIENDAQKDRENFLKALGKLWQRGHTIIWREFYKDKKRKRIALPTYPFEKQKYWIEVNSGGRKNDSQLSVKTALNGAKDNKHKLKRTNLENEYQSPTNRKEKMLISIWEDILQVEGIGLEDNLYDLGGDSLIATQIFARVQQQLKGNLTLEKFMSNLNIKDLANLIEDSDFENRETQNFGNLQTIIPQIEKEKYPLSFAQERLWLTEQMVTKNPMYNLPAVVKLKGNLKIEALAKAYAQIIAKQSSLRTTFHLIDGIPYQKIEKENFLPLEISDISYLPENKKDEILKKLVRGKITEPFDLEKSAPQRFGLIKLSETEHIAVLVLHHIISDAWSMNIFVQELGSAYREIVSGKPANNIELPIQYKDFAEWQKQPENLDKAADQLKYWKQQLKNTPQLLDLPLDKPRPEKRSYNGESYSFSLKNKTTEKLLETGKKFGATVYTLLLSSFAVLLNNICDQEEVIIGTPVAGRTLPETEPLIGCFINTLPIKVDLSKKPKFEEIIAQVKQTTIKAYTNQNVPFEKILDVIELKRSTEYMPLVQVLFDFLNTPPGKELELPELELQLMAAEVGTAKNDLVFDLWQGSETISGTVEFNTDIFELKTIENIIENYKQIVEYFMSNPEARIHHLKTENETGKIAFTQDARNDLIKQRFAPKKIKQEQ